MHDQMNLYSKGGVFPPAAFASLAPEFDSKKRECKKCKNKFECLTTNKQVCFYKYFSGSINDIRTNNNNGLLGSALGAVGSSLGGIFGKKSNV